MEMNIPHALLPPALRYRRLLHSAAALFLAITILATHQTASAWSLKTVQGRPGSAIVSNIAVADLLMPAGYSAFTLLGETRPFAYRSPAFSGGQIIQALYVVQRWNGSAWVNVANSGLIRRQISSTQPGAYFPAPYIQPAISKGYFRLLYIFDYYTAAGVALGRSWVIPNLVTDHKCVTPKRPCAVAAGYFWTGALYAL